MGGDPPHRCQSRPTGPWTKVIVPDRRERHVVTPGLGPVIRLLLPERPTSLQVRLRTPPRRSLMSREEVLSVISVKGRPVTITRLVSVRTGVAGKPVFTLKTGVGSSEDGRKLNPEN